MMIEPGEYRFGVDTGRLLVRTYRTGLGSRAGHDLVIGVASWRGTATVGPDAAASAVTVTLDVDSFEVREGRGGVKPLTNSDRADIQKTIRDKILFSGRYPVIEFRSTTVEGSPSSLSIDGSLTIRGITRPTRVEGKIDDAPEEPHVSATARVVQSEWDIKPYTAFLGALKLRDAVDIEVEANLVPASRA